MAFTLGYLPFLYLINEAGGFHRKSFLLSDLFRQFRRWYLLALPVVVVLVWFCELGNEFWVFIELLLDLGDIDILILLVVGLHVLLHRLNYPHEIRHTSILHNCRAEAPILQPLVLFECLLQLFILLLLTEHLYDVWDLVKHANRQIFLYEVLYGKQVVLWDAELRVKGVVVRAEFLKLGDALDTVDLLVLQIGEVTECSPHIFLKLVDVRCSQRALSWVLSECDRMFRCCV